MRLNEAVAEEAALLWLDNLGYSIVRGTNIAPGEPDALRDSYTEVVLADRLAHAIDTLNPDAGHDAAPSVRAEILHKAQQKLLAPASQSLIVNNREFHKMLINGVEVEYARRDGTQATERIKAVDFDRPLRNEFWAVNQFTVTGSRERRPDIVLFVNGLPLAVIELKNPADPNATLDKAYAQLQTYKAQIPALFVPNALLVISDGTFARVGTLTSDRERFLPWRTMDGKTDASPAKPELEVLLTGAFDRAHFLELIRAFTVYNGQGEKTIKMVAGYHQFHAVRAAEEETVRASGLRGDKRGGVVWHTQGSGKSLTMAFFAARIAKNPLMQNPTIVVLTDRNDLDEQLFGTFSASVDLLRQTPQKATSRANLRDLLSVDQGGIVFTTIQKFAPELGEEYELLTDRRNVVVLADEAHRSQYDILDGYARHLRDGLPGATFLGFTGTPIEKADRSTRGIFGNDISVYDIGRAQKDGATVPIYYEGRFAKLGLSEAEQPHIDPAVEEITEGAETTAKEAAKRKWAQLEAVVGTPKRLERIAADLVAHFENRCSSLAGKGMIVAMSRRVAVELYDAIVRERPDWHSDDETTGAIKVVMTGSASDPLSWQRHIHNKAERERLAARLKDPADPLKLVIVRDMWLTGFDAPCLHTMYVDKPMKGHSLMQAIARVNRVFGDKPGGLIVDYIGIAESLKAAVAQYAESGGKGQAVLDQAEAVALMLEKLEICEQIFHGFDSSLWKSRSPVHQLAVLPAAQEFLLDRDRNKGDKSRMRFLDAALALTKAFALAVPHDDALRVRDEVAFFQAVRAALLKKPGSDTKSGPTSQDIHHALRQIVSRSVVSDEVVDIFGASGLQRPDVSILSDEFLDEVRNLPYRNLAVEALQKLLAGEIKTRLSGNVAQGRKFSEMLQNTLLRYQSRGLETAQVIEALIELAKQLREAENRGESMGLTYEEAAFYDALETSESAVAVLGDAVLFGIARELTKMLKANATVDWSVKETARANLRRLVKRILRKHGYPPDKQEKATDTVLEQAEAVAAGWD